MAIVKFQNAIERTRQPGVVRSFLADWRARLNFYFSFFATRTAFFATRTAFARAFHTRPTTSGLVLLLAIFQGIYISYPPVPGNDPAFPLGWWGWFDQGEYYKSALAFIHGDLRGSEHFYPPLYSAMASIFLPQSKMHAFYPVDLALTAGFYLIYVSLFSRYVGRWGAVICCLVGMVAFRPFRLQWVIPWTSTPSAILLISALFLLDRYARRRADLDYSRRSRAMNALGFGLVVGSEALVRPVDIAVAAPMAVIYGMTVLGDVFAGDKAQADAKMEMFGGACGVVLPLLVYLMFNHVVFGSFFGQYFSMVSSNGFNIWCLPEKFFSHLLASQVFYGEQNADWLSVVPLILAAVLMLPAALFTGPLVFRAAAAAGMLQFVLYYSYSDILPTGTFRYMNIHYFKWLAPVAVGLAFYFIKQAFSSRYNNAVRRRASIAVCGSIAFGLLIISITATQKVGKAFNVAHDDKTITFNLSGDEALDFVDLLGIGGDWTHIYFPAHAGVVLDNSLQLAAIHDFRFLPISGGVRVLFFSSIRAHEMTVRLGDGMTVPPNFSGTSVQPVAVAFGLGKPLSQQWAPAEPPRPYEMGILLMK